MKLKFTTCQSVDPVMTLEFFLPHVPDGKSAGVFDSL